MAGLKEWYTTKNSMLIYENEQNPGLYVKGVAEMLEELSAEDKTFSRQDLEMLLDVMSYYKQKTSTKSARLYYKSIKKA